TAQPTERDARRDTIWPTAEPANMAKTTTPGTHGARTSNNRTKNDGSTAATSPNTAKAANIAMAAGTKTGRTSAGTTGRSTFNRAPGRTSSRLRHTTTATGTNNTRCITNGSRSGEGATVASTPLTNGPAPRPSMFTMVAAR